MQLLFYLMGILRRYCELPDIAQFIRIPLYDRLHCEGVLNMERILIVFFQQSKCIIPCYHL